MEQAGHVIEEGQAASQVIDGGQVVDVAGQGEETGGLDAAVLLPTEPLSPVSCLVVASTLIFAAIMSMYPLECFHFFVIKNFKSAVG